MRKQTNHKGFKRKIRFEVPDPFKNFQIPDEMIGNAIKVSLEHLVRMDVDKEYAGLDEETRIKMGAEKLRKMGEMAVA